MNKNIQQFLLRSNIFWGKEQLNLTIFYSKEHFFGTINNFTEKGTVTMMKEQFWGQGTIFGGQGRSFCLTGTIFWGKGTIYLVVNKQF